MATVSAADSGAEASGHVKDEGGTTPPGDGRGSPPPNCAICLGQCQNKCFTDSCLHQFCFHCLLTWSKIKAECPLCKQNFKSIIHNVRSNDQYEEYLVEQREAEALAMDEPVADYTRRFRYRTTITFPRRDGSAIHRLLLRSPLVSDVALPPRPDAYGHRNTFRRTIYRHNLWARPLPDFTGRLRDCSPEFYRNNDAQRYRLVPWLTRELTFLLNDDGGHRTTFMVGRIIDLLPISAINSADFRAALLPYLRDRTDHFLHELYCFATTPYDILGYDRNVQYGVDPRLNPILDQVISSSDSDSVDSDIVLVSSSQQLPVPLRVPTPSSDPGAGVSRPPMDNVIPIETISHSDTEDSSSEVIMVGYIKPPQDRTPEIVDLLASDSDVLVQENSPPASTSRDASAPSQSLVKLTLSHTQLPDSDSDEWVPQLARPKRKRRVRTHSASTTSTRRGTPAPTDASWNPSDTTASAGASPDRSDTYDEPCIVPRIAPHSDKSDSRCKRKRSESSKDGKLKRYRKKLKRKRARSRSPQSPSQALLDHQRRRTKDKSSKLRKHKSRSGKDVKSSKRSAELRVQQEDLEQPGTSGTQGPSWSREEQDRLQAGTERKKLRSVVCTLPISSFNGRSQPDAASQSSSSDATRSTMKHTIENILRSKATSSEDRSTSNYLEAYATDVMEGSSQDNSPVHGLRRPTKNRFLTSSDSDDDLPLNLTVKKLN